MFSCLRRRVFVDFRRFFGRGCLLVAIVSSYCVLKAILLSQQYDKTDRHQLLPDQRALSIAINATLTTTKSRDVGSEPHLTTSELIGQGRGGGGGGGGGKGGKGGVIRDPFDIYFNADCPSRYLDLPEYATKECAKQTQFNCRQLTCRNILTGRGNDTYEIAKRLMDATKRPIQSDSAIANATSDCNTYKTERGYQMAPLDNGSREFVIAFNILVHKDADQVDQLLRAIYRPQNLYCIHVDSRANPEFMAAMRSIAGCFDNVRLASKLETLTWGGYSRLQADLNCMKDHLTSGVDWKYLINTAGQAFPLQTVEEMVKILKLYNGANDIEGIYGNRVLKSRSENEWEEEIATRTMKKTGRRNPKPPHDIDIVRGSAYGIFSRKFVEFILNDRKAIDLAEWSKKTWSPDELYWATLHHTYSNPHLHTPGGFPGYPSDKPWLAVYANWDGNTCRGRVVRGVCVFGVGDLAALLPRKEFFVNKFYIDFQPLGLDCFASWIRHKEACPVAFDDAYYRSLNFIQRT